MNVLLQNPTVRRVGLHLGFWVGMWGLLVFDVLESTLNRTLLIKLMVYGYVVLTCVIVAYLNSYGLLPKLLRRRRYVAYFAALAGLLLAVAWLNDVLLAWWIGTQPMVIERFFSLLGITLFVMGIKLLRDDQAVQLRVSTLERIQAGQELQLLKSQVNPHFLFNTLNSIYALALNDSKRTADTVLKLAELMQYMVSTAPLSTVDLAKEIAYLTNYLSLEKIRLNPSANITFRGQGDFSRVSLAPMLLLPFVENAFKHGVETQVQNINVEIDASLQGNEFFFQVLNSKPGGCLNNQESSSQTGLGNVRKRLSLLYPDRHELTLTDTDTNYRVKPLDQAMTSILIVDDEPLARQVLERYVATRPDLHLVGSCANAYEALALLQREPVALLLCDIKMPEVDGFALIRSLTNPPRIILTTAHPDYALVSYDIGVVDYLMKPISLDRFMKALNRAIHPAAAPTVAPPERKPLDYLFFKVDKAFRKVFVNEIQFIEAYGNYVKVHTDSEMLLVPGKISALETTLDTGQFIRVHKSYLVALAKIRQIENNQVHFEQAVVPIGESYRAGLRSAAFGRAAFPNML